MRFTCSEEDGDVLVIDENLRVIGKTLRIPVGVSTLGMFDELTQTRALLRASLLSRLLPAEVAWHICGYLFPVKERYELTMVAGEDVHRGYEAIKVSGVLDTHQANYISLMHVLGQKILSTHKNE